MPGLLPGARLADGRFVLVRELGRGGIGAVWLAQDTSTDTRVALKILAPAFARHPGARELLRREYQRQHALVHPHILRVHALLDSDDTQLLVMQHAPGGDVRHLRGAPWRRLLPLLVQVADALAHAHDAGVVHRDLKAANVLLDENGRACVADFGHAAPAAGGAGEVPEGGGTAATMSPQQLEGAAPSPADDLYAFGALCYELLSGGLPLGDAPDPATVRVRVPPSLGAQAPGLPERLVALVDSLLAKSPAARPASMAVVRDRLEALGQAAIETSAAAPAGRSAAAARAAGEDGDDEALAIAPVTPRRRRRGQPGGVAAGVGSGPGPPEDASGPAGGSSGGMRRRGRVAAAPQLPGGPAAWTAAAFIVLISLLLFTVIWLPRLGAPGELPAEAPLAEDAMPGVSAPGPGREPPPAGRREDAEAVLGVLVNLQNRLTPLEPTRWAGEDWSRATELGERGDDLLLARRFNDAEAAYSEALSVLQAIEAALPEVFDAAMTRGGEALAAGRQAAAQAAFEEAVRLRPDDAAAGAALARAEALDAVLEAMQRGARAEHDGALDTARAAYAEALELDGQWTPAREALARVRRTQADAGFQALLSRGYGFIGNERYREAIEAFEEALAVRPDAADAREGLVQAQLGFRLQRIGLAQLRATAFERQERWEEALAQYREALEIDESLGFAREGRARAEARASLEAKLEALNAAPGRLFDDRVLAEAEAVLSEARETFDDAGGRRLATQIERLARLIELATTPVDVVLRSDGLTEVRVFRVGPIGRFEETTLQLRPGDYTIIGSRDGFRDVRVTLAVRPGQAPAPLSVICTEPI